jgi:hypothetical protein
MHDPLSDVSYTQVNLSCECARQQGVQDTTLESASVWTTDQTIDIDIGERAVRCWGDELSSGYYVFCVLVLAFLQFLAEKSITIKCVLSSWCICCDAVMNAIT